MKSKTALGVFILVFLCVFSAPIFADENEEAAIRAFFQTDEPDYKALFASAFLEKISSERMEKVRRDYMTALGNIKSVTAQGPEYEVRFAKGKIACRVLLDDEGKIASFWIGPMKMNDDSLDKVLADFKKLDGAFSLAVLRNGLDEVVIVNPDLPMAVGSSFKLYVLEALEKKMKTDGVTWDTVVKLNMEHYSLPTGIVQNWPADTPVTLQTLAHLMISISDNTATDQLLFYVGREAVEKLAPPRVKPLYSTAEMFRLKYGLEAGARDKYFAAELAEKRRMLTGLSEISLEELDFQPMPLFIDKLEWIISTRELGEVIYRLRENPSLYINPGLANKRSWRAVGFKGGSEPGVLNHTYLLQKDDQSPWLSISVTINNPKKEIDEDQFNELIIRLIDLADAGKLK